MIFLIVALAENNVIGVKNDLPWHLRDDLRRFKTLTDGRTVVMGRKTYESIVARLGHALPNRRNVVVTRQAVTLPDTEVLHDLSSIGSQEDVFVIGGAQLYEQMLDVADVLYVTEVKATVAGDAYFPKIEPNVWREVAREAHKKDEHNDYDYDFVVYQRLKR